MRSIVENVEDPRGGKNYGKKCRRSEGGKEKRIRLKSPNRTDGDKEAKGWESRILQLLDTNTITRIWNRMREGERRKSMDHTLVGEKRRRRREVQM